MKYFFSRLLLSCIGFCTSLHAVRIEIDVPSIAGDERQEFFY